MLICYFESFKFFLIKFCNSNFDFKNLFFTKQVHLINKTICSK